MASVRAPQIICGSRDMRISSSRLSVGVILRVSQLGGSMTFPPATCARNQRLVRLGSGWRDQPQTAGADSTRRSISGGLSLAVAARATAPPMLTPQTAMMAVGWRARARAAQTFRSSSISSPPHTPRWGERPKPRWA